MHPRRASLLLLAALTAVAATACGGSDGTRAAAVTTTTSTTTATACAAEVQETLDSRSTQHVFPGAPEPAYLTDPPTSGPHRLGAAPTGAVHTPIDRPMQVHMLEDGTVLVQYKDLTAAQQVALEGLAGGQVVVAPNADLKVPVVATAWTYKMTCTDVDAAAIRGFAARHAGKGAGHP